MAKNVLSIQYTASGTHLTVCGRSQDETAEALRSHHLYQYNATHIYIKVTSGPHSTPPAEKTVCLLADGIHHITSMINFGSYNSGTEAHPVRLIGNPADIAAGRGRPVVSGAVRKINA